MPRHYYIASCRGSAQKTVERLQKIIRRHEASELIPVVRFEKGQKKSRRNSEFYLALAVESDARRAPLLLQDVVKDAHLRLIQDRPVKEKIESFFTGALELETLITHRLLELYQDLRRPPRLCDPHDSASGEIELDPERARQRGCERLLCWLSAAGRGSRDLFVRMCQALQLIEEPREAWQLRRRLSLLGHLEWDRRHRHWTVCPPTLVRCAAFPESAYLAGQRTAQLLAACGSGLTAQSHASLAPPAFFVDDPDAAAASLAAHQVEDAGVSGFILAHRLPRLAGWHASLPRVHQLIPSKYTFELWNGTCYQKVGHARISGLYRLATRRLGEAGPRRSLYYEQASNQWLEGDWFGLRFLWLHASGRLRPAIFSPERQALAIARDEIWPDLYERALVLCSGRLPDKPDDSDFKVYHGIPRDVAGALCGRLGVPLQELEHA